MEQTKQVIRNGATTALGLFSGAMLLIAVAIMPYWKSLNGESYRASFQAIGPYFGSVMVPLMLVAIVLSAIATFSRNDSISRTVVTFCLVALIVPLYLVFSAPINAELLGNSPLSEPLIIQLRGQWFFWHWTRTLLGTGAFLLTVFGRARS